MRADDLRLTDDGIEAAFDGLLSVPHNLVLGEERAVYRAIADAATAKAAWALVEWLKSGARYRPGNVMTPAWYAGDAVEAALEAAGIPRPSDTILTG